ncbi:hypothetical protein [Streptomyces sp. NPDC127072]|uniref:hypothetical protein n=1 Tax=Streptomyces sp. NPDC127072 TaxID=3347129 RepID=UPI0036616BAA
MTPWHRALRVAGLLPALTIGAAALSYAAPYAGGHAASPGAPRAVSYAVPYAPEPGDDASRAGSHPGEGRERPGRKAEGEDAAPTYTDRDPAVLDRPDPNAASEPPREAAIPVRQNVVRPGIAPEPVLRIVPLGSGLILIGLGLGLAFLALRVRRG